MRRRLQREHGTPAGATLEAARQLRGRRAVVFDLDGTLVDTLPDLVFALDATLAEFGAGPVPASVVRATLHGGLEASAAGAVACLGLDPALTERVGQAYASRYALAPAVRSRAYDGVPDLLALLEARGTRLAVCTNKRLAEAERVLEGVGLSARFVTVVGADSCARRKPDPQPLLAALAALQAAPGESVLVGDSSIDAQTAHAAGVDCVLHAGGYGELRADEPGVRARFGAYGALLAALAD